MGSIFSKKGKETVDQMDYLFFQFFLGCYDPNSLLFCFPHDIFHTIFAFQTNYWKDYTPELLEIKERSTYAQKIQGSLVNRILIIFI